MMVRNHRSRRHHHHHRRRRSRHLQRHKHIDRAYNQHWATHNVHFVSSTVRNAVVCTRGEREGEVQTWNSSRPNGHTSSSSTVAAAAAAAAALVGIEGIGLSLCYRHLDIGPFLEGLVVEPIDCAFRAVWILIAHRCVALWQSGLLVLVDPHLFLALVLALALLDLANLPEKLDQSAQSQRLSDQACACAAGRRPATAAGSRRRTQANAPLPLAPRVGCAPRAALAAMCGRGPLRIATRGAALRGPCTPSSGTRLKDPAAHTALCPSRPRPGIGHAPAKNVPGQGSRTLHTPLLGDVFREALHVYGVRPCFHCHPARSILQPSSELFPLEGACFCP